jgi:apolipoprotein N-acyltransferase
MQRIAGTIILLEGWRRGLVAFLAGAVATLALAPFDLPFAGFLAFPVLVWLLDGAVGEPSRGSLGRLWPAFRVGWCFGFGYFVGGLWWLGSAMLVDVASFWWALPFAVFGLPAVLALYHGLAAALARSLWSEGGGRVFALAASFALAEYLRGFLLTGFSWNEIGLMVAPVPLMMQSLAVVGVHGLTFAAVLVFAAPALIVGSPALRSLTLAVAGLLTVAHLGYGAFALSRGTPSPVEGVALRIVQPNILQSQKWDAAEAERIFATLLDLSGRGRGEGQDETLVVWPESSVPFILTDSPEGLARVAAALEPGETLLAGAARAEGPREDPDRRYYNSVLVIDDEGTIVDARDKVHLVPFGEYLPFQDTLEAMGITQLTQLPGGFSAGTTREPVRLADGVSFLALICYEIIFQDEISLPDDPAERPGFILNITNDAWYGTTPGPYQHLRSAQASAVAYGLPLVRAANTGVSVVTDARGREIAGLGLNQEGVVASTLPAPLPETVFSRVRNLPFLFILLFGFAVALRERWRLSRPMH